MAKNKKTTEQFIAEAKEVWGDRWDYSNTEYVRASDKVIITCLEHGDFSQLPSNHLKKAVGCKECYKKEQRTLKVWSRDEFLTKAIQVWGDSLDFSKAVYVNSSTPVTVTCPKHGDFSQTPKQIWAGSTGCKECFRENQSTTLRMTQEEFMDAASSVWGDRWDLSKVVYSGSQEKVVVVCKEHGDFQQIAASFLQGRVGCVECVSIKRSNTSRIVLRKKPPATLKRKVSTRKRMSTEAYKDKFISKFGSKYDLSKVEYLGNKVPVTIICPEHGEFSRAPKNMVNSNTACLECAGGRMSRNSVETALREMWGDRWDFSGTVFTTASGYFSAVCPEHGEFRQLTSKALSGTVGCDICSGRRIDLNSFLSSSANLWGDRWDYSLVEFHDVRTEVTIICPSHGKFKQKPSLHLRGNVGCSRCSRQGMSSEEFVAEAKEVWGERWDFSKVEYQGAFQKVTVSCPLHGDFEQLPYYLLGGAVGCRKCSIPTRTIDEVMEKSILVWGDRWDFSKSSDLSNSKTPFTITCPEHGEFKQSPDNLLKGYLGCYRCHDFGTSQAEKSIRELLLDIGVNMPSTYISHGGRKYEIDMYSEELRVGIEFNGVYWHSEKFREREYHYNKSVAAAGNGIRLLHVWEDDWLFKNDIVKEHILRVLGKSSQPKIAARKMKVMEADFSTATEFLERTHIQGGTSATYYIGGFYEGELVALACFKKRGEDYELVRYATSAIVQGGHSKLVSYFEKNYSYQNLITFADLTFSDGGLYKNTGWIEDKVLAPDYQYLVNGVRKHKFGYRIERFKRDPDLQYMEGMTERELAELNGLLRVYDAGKIRFIKPHP